MNKISFIIPAYNAEYTIEKTIHSIVKQFQNEEIIVVENGSNDRTVDIVNEIIKKNNTVKLIHTEKGVSKARNAGIKEASGEWIAFVDADDEWCGEKKQIYNLINILEKTDFITFSYLKDRQAIIHDYSNLNCIIDGDNKIEAESWFLKRPTLRMTVWSKLFSKKFLKDNNLFFNPNLRFSEDSEFMIRVLQVSNAYAISDQIIYKYCCNNTSTTRKIDYTRQEDYIKALEEFEKSMIRDNEKRNIAFRNYVITQLNIIGVHDVFNCNLKIKWEERKSILKAILRHSLIEKQIESIRASDLTDAHFLPALLFSKHFYTMGGLIYYLRSLKNERTGLKAKSV